jgi:peptidyl-prolyl cis-trans isomerase C
MFARTRAAGAALLLIFLLTTAAVGAEIKGDSDVATVNGASISQARLDRELSRQEQQLLMQGLAVEESQRPAFRREVLDRLINQELILQESIRLGYTAAPEDLEAQIEAIRGQFPDQESFLQSLAQWSFTEESLKEEIARGLTIQAFIDREINAQISITPDEAGVYYAEHPEQFAREEQIRARHILIMLEEGADAAAEKDARDRIEEIQQKLQSGEDFSSLAKEFSEGPSAPRGGDLGYFGRGQMVAPFEEAAFALSAGGVSDIVRTAYGFHLIELVDRQPAGLIDFEEVREDLISYLTQERVIADLEDLIGELRSKAEIEVPSQEG